jgi:hypothetical protein
LPPGNSRYFGQQCGVGRCIGGPEHRHGSAWSDSIAFTHCICFGAAVRAVEPLLLERDLLDAALAAVAGAETLDQARGIAHAALNREEYHGHEL